MEEYGQVWERFVRDRRLEFGGHMDPEWQDGHALSASLMIPVDALRLRERLEPLRDALRPFPLVSLHPDHFAHVTVVLLGFLVEKPTKKGEVSRERLGRIEASAREVLKDFPAFAVRLANLNAFPGAAFVEAHDGGMLDRLREVLSVRCGLEKPKGPPHLTLAYFHAPDGTPVPEALISAIEPYRDWPVGEVPVDGVELTLLDLGMDYPEPERLARIPLKRAG
ncbi:MAG: 2'-5' RNA ligase family protein [Actinomycetota bacterium]|nr:2'-5' RNA ligase family protein [Actinomycetota bacterium]